MTKTNDNDSDNATYAEPNPAEGGNSTLDPYPARYPPQCRLYNYEKEFLPSVGCSCDSFGCRLRTEFSADQKIPFIGCSAAKGTPCFGKDEVTCHPAAKTQKGGPNNACHTSCATCSPGMTANGNASPDACRSCSNNSAWMPKAGMDENIPECSIGQQQGRCESYPSPARRCKTSCSPSTLTTDHKPVVLRMVNDSNSNKTNYVYEGDIPILACAKACTDGYAVNLRTVHEAAQEAAKDQRYVREEPPACSNSESPWMLNNNKTCESWGIFMYNNKCQHDEEWRTGKYCQKSCYDSGNGYVGDECSGANNNVTETTHADGTPQLGSWHVDNQTTIFCAAYKLVTCKWQASPPPSSTPGPTPATVQTTDNSESDASGTWETDWGPKPTDELGGKYLCNQRKHITLLGFQLHSDEDNVYLPSETFYAVNSQLVRSMTAPWDADPMFRTASANINRTIFPDVKPHMVYGKPTDDPTGAKVYDFAMQHQRSLCMKHLLLS